MCNKLLTPAIVTQLTTAGQLSVVAWQDDSMSDYFSSDEHLNYLASVGFTVDPTAMTDINSLSCYVPPNEPITPSLDTSVLNDTDLITWDESNASYVGVPKNSDSIPEGSTNLYYSEAAVSSNTDVVANTAKVSADGSVTSHSDVTDAGSGQIITAVERSAIGTNTSDITALQGQSHAAVSLAVGNDSALVLSGQELNLTLPASIATAIQPGDNVSELVNDVSFITDLTSFDTDDLTEGNNLYYTEARVTANTTVQQLLTVLDQRRHYAIIQTNGTTDNNPNYNTITLTPVSFNGTPSSFGDFTTTVNSVVCNFTGQVAVNYEVPTFSSGQRPTLRGAIYVDNTTEYAQSYTYIRNSSGHNRDTNSGFALIDVVPGTVIQVVLIRQGTITTAVNIEQIARLTVRRFS